MRLAGLIAVSMLVAACSHSVGGEAETTGTTSASASETTAPTSAAPAPSVPRSASAAPARGAPIEEVIEWIEAGVPADPGDYHVAFRDGVTTRLGDDVAFTAPSGAPHDSVRCITAAIYNDGAPTCLLDLDSPAPRPACPGSQPCSRYHVAVRAVPSAAPVVARNPVSRRRASDDAR